MAAGTTSRDAISPAPIPVDQRQNVIGLVNEKEKPSNRSVRFPVLTSGYRRRAEHSLADALVSNVSIFSYDRISTRHP